MLSSLSFLMGRSKHSLGSPFSTVFFRAGRKFIGATLVKNFSLFFEALARETCLRVYVEKIRGKNAHHIVESAFKAFSRCLRGLIDAQKRDLLDFNPVPIRSCEISRSTNETQIDVRLILDNGGEASINSGLVTLDDLLGTIAAASNISLDVECKGDLWIDDHHSAEDAAIAFGQALKQALGTKAGLNRMWSVEREFDGCSVSCTMDISNRPHLEHDLQLEECDEEMVGDLSIEMIDHVLDSIVMNAGMTVHFQQQVPGGKFSAYTISKAACLALGECLKFCVAIDSRRGGKTASSKGTLNV